jgi:5'-phosphate synthase pdxT subunit|tara:strand:+ start:3870 stop:4448 length:579 start_codon:yes stop_codon:yes gene_type:complete
MKTGVLALQGSYFDHVKSLELIDKEYTLIKSAKDLDNIDSLILPGGESTAMMKIQKDDNLFEKIKIKINDGMPTLGTCAGLILLAKDVIDGESSIACLNTVVERNAYGRQNESFEGLVEFNGNKEMYCFIRAPKIISYGNSVNPIASIDDEIVGIHENNIVGLSFHPELTNDNVYLKWLKNFLKDGLNVRTL